MSLIRPFRALRVNPFAASQVAAPPYDTLSTQEAREMAHGNAQSFLRIDKPEIEFPKGFDPYSPAVYTKGRELLEQFRTVGTLVREATPAFYLYRQTMQGRTQTGLMATTSVDEYRKGLIRKHEHTRPEKVNDRANHILGSGSQASPVLSTYRWNADVDALFREIAGRKIDVDFIGADATRHEMWFVTDASMIAKLTTAFAKIPMLYIADGHHRSEAASEVCARLEAKDPRPDALHRFFLNGLFPDRDLFIMPYHRVIRDLNGMSPEQFLTRIKESFEVSPSAGQFQPKERHQFGLYLKGQWYQLHTKAGLVNDSDPVGSIDAAILGRLLIEPVLGISNPRTDKRIDFVGGIRGTKELQRLVDSGEFALAISLNATSIAQLLAVADRNEVMPPKSTWFEPKLASGLVVSTIQE